MISLDSQTEFRKHLLFLLEQTIKGAFFIVPWLFAVAVVMSAMAAAICGFSSDLVAFVLSVIGYAMVMEIEIRVLTTRTNM